MNGMNRTDRTAPNHHAQYPAFSGITGLIAALSMLVGRTGDAELALRLSGAGAGDTIIDIGCGPGTAARRAAHAGATVIGVDPAPVMLWVARLMTRPGAPVRYVVGSAEALGLPASSASVVWSIASVHHWSDIGAALAQIEAVLQPGGRLVAIEHLTTPGARGHASHGWTDQQAAAFAEACSASGFTELRVERHSRARRPSISVTATRP
jgi:ubiquinone/menaquinone biosynthesis C-methylase UbiE